MPDNIMTRAIIAPRSINERERTVDVIATTGAGVTRHDLDGPFLERLEISPRALNAERMDGMPFLDSHRQDGIDRVIGVVRGFRFSPAEEGGALIVTVQISERHEAVWRDIKAGILRNVSIGYAPIEWRDAEINGERVRTVTRWALHEVSLVAVGADPSAKVRSGHMPNTSPAGTPSTQPAPPPVTPPAAETRAVIDTEIRALATEFGYDATRTDQFIRLGGSADEFRAVLRQTLTAPAGNPAPRVIVGATHDDPDSFVTRAADALYVSRVNPSAEMPDASRQFAHMSLADLAAEGLHLRGISTMGMNSASIITRSFQTTSDLPNLLTGVGNRTLGEAYASVPSAVKTLGRKKTAPDFRSQTTLKIDSNLSLEKLGEHGEIKSGSLMESKEAWALETFARATGLSRNALVNDDLGALTDVLSHLGQAAADKEAQLLVDLLEKNSGNGPTMDDTNPLFHSAHGNKAGSGAAIAEATLSAARLAMRKQTSPAGRKIGVAPKWLLLPPDLETKGEKELSAIQAATVDDHNPFAGKLSIIVEPRFSSATRWYIVGANAPDLIWAYLAGQQEGPRLETRVAWNPEGVEMKVVLDFGCAFLDHRGWYLNAGA
jgi:HK97 family phage prohead protease